MKKWERSQGKFSGGGGAHKSMTGLWHLAPEIQRGRRSPLENIKKGAPAKKVSKNT